MSLAKVKGCADQIKQREGRPGVNVPTKLVYVDVKHKRRSALHQYCINYCGVMASREIRGAKRYAQHDRDLDHQQTTPPLAKRARCRSAYRNSARCYSPWPDSTTRSARTFTISSSLRRRIAKTRFQIATLSVKVPHGAHWTNLLAHEITCRMHLFRAA